MNEIIKLGIEQEEALNLILKFIKTKKVAFSLSGYAGTGKSFLIKALIDELDKLKIDYTLCAPTHKAKTVLERFTGKEGITVHKLLALSPNINIIDLDFRNLQFLSKLASNYFPFDSIIICDESSMINDYLFGLLIDRCKSANTKIIFVGDIKQIKPVNSIQTSKVFELEDNYFLTQIFRQNHESALSEVLPISREQFIPRFKTDICEKGSIYTFSQPRDFFMKSIPYFNKAIENLDILESKILSYTNDRVAYFNIKMVEALFGLEKEYNKFQFITGYENLVFDDYSFWNSMDYIIMQEPESILINIPHVGLYPGYKLVLWDSSDKCEQTVNILSKYITEQKIRTLTYTIEHTRLEAIDLKERKSRLAGLKWKEYYSIMNSFTTPIDLYFDNRLIRKKSFDGGYATTIHRSQGSSINNTFIDMKSIDFCRDEQEKRQLQYVALSRSKNNVYILQ